MISQRCPKCRSPRIRRGYRSTPLWSKILFRYNLLCDNCNLEFKGFAIPGTVRSRPNRSSRRHIGKETQTAPVAVEADAMLDERIEEQKVEIELISANPKPKAKKKSRSKVKSKTAE